MAGKKRPTLSIVGGRGTKGKGNEPPQGPDEPESPDLVDAAFDEDEPLDGPYLDEELPFSAALITPPEPKTLKQFFCPACGHQIVGPKGVNPCPHTLFVMESGEERVFHCDARLKEMIPYLKKDPEEVDQDPFDFMYDIIIAKFEFPYGILHVELEGFELADVPGEVVLDLVLDFSAGL